MTEVKFELENCYGIKKFKHTFKFDRTKVHSIYAPNGFMKTSFSKTINDLCNGIDSKDAVYLERKTIRIIKDQTGRDIEGNDVFVVEPYNPGFNSEKTSLLLVNSELKDEYDIALRNLDDRKNELLKKMQSLSGITGRKVTPENIILNLYGKKSLYDVIENYGDYSSGIEQDRLAKIKYNSIFNDKTMKFITSGDMKSEIEDYIKTYEKLIDESPILCNTFNHSKAETISKNLSDTGFFSANHSVNLFDGENKNEFTNADDLKRKIDEDKNKVLNSTELKKKFNQIDQKVSNNDLRELREYLNENNHILTEMDDIPKIQKNIFRSYLIECKDLVDNLIAEYHKNKETIEEVISKAKEQNTEWQKVVNEFNRRFSVPFVMKVENKEDVILNDKAPVLEFEFKDGEEGKKIDKNDLVEILSQGERRALYILNLLFEINVRKKEENVQLIVIDDIADSFDYKNKYAIVQYLKEVTEESKFVTIFLTHNYDFHRIISSRLDIKRKNRYFINKNSTGIEIYEEKYQKNPFTFWKNNLTNDRYLVSAIPFVRNLAEYCGSEIEFEKLTSMLHIKNESNTLTKGDLQEIIKKIIKDQSSLSIENHETLISTLIENEADQIVSESDSNAELESKVVLAMAIRLKAEMYMISKIADEDFVTSIESNQTMKLYKRYLELFPDSENISTLTDVNIMTPENIHLNSFMYEPILDMSPANLKSLYLAVRELNT